MRDMEQLKELLNGRDGFNRHNGIRVTAVGEGWCDCQVTLTDEGKNPHGTAHGGLLFTMCDTAAGIAASSASRGVVSRTGEIHFIAPAVGGTLTAKGRVVRAGRHMAYCTAEVFDEAGEMLVSASFEMFFLPGPTGEA